MLVTVSLLVTSLRRRRSSSFRTTRSIRIRTLPGDGIQKSNADNLRMKEEGSVVGPLVSIVAPRLLVSSQSSVFDPSELTCPA
jgi:hypothetical protein